MHEAVREMLSKYACQRLEDTVRALREIMQEVALLGLWRSKFFEKAAFYGGTALRILHGLDRYSEDLDFSLLSPVPEFNLSAYTSAVEKELRAFGFDVRVEQRSKSAQTPVQSAFLKADTLSQLLVIETAQDMVREIPKGQVLKIKLEVDTDPPPGFRTQMRYLLMPIPFAVRVYEPQDLFAGKMHAILCRSWKGRVKGRDWYDLVWFVARQTGLHLMHLEHRMRQTGHWTANEALTPEAFQGLLNKTIEHLDIEQARREVTPFVKDPQHLVLWSADFFTDLATRIRIV